MKVLNKWEDTWLKEIGLYFQLLITTPHATLNTIERTYVSNLRNQQTCTSNNRNEIKGSPIPNPIFVEVSFTYLPMQHEFSYTKPKH